MLARKAGLALSLRLTNRDLILDLYSEVVPPISSKTDFSTAWDMDNTRSVANQKRVSLKDQQKVKE